jgi:triacylglycerol esterase/lipase EstA (alpha/beta hydrolase family)
MRRLLLSVVAAALVAVPVVRADAGAAAADPPWSVDPKLLEAALECPHPFTHPEHEPVLLVHGTFTNAHENFSWNYELALPELGFDYCLVDYGTYTNRATEDMQASAEFVAYAVNAMYERAGRKVDVIGHSQGGMMPRWAIKWWPSVQARVDDFVAMAGPHHGVQLANDVEGSPFGAPPVAWQFDPSSQFVAALNAGDETPGAIDYTSIYATTDELVQPVSPVPTAVLDWEHEGPNVRNVNVQDLCPGRLVEHLTIGTTDRVSMALVLDALAHPGPVDPDRLELSPLCVLPDQYTSPAQLQVFGEQFGRTFGGEFSSWQFVDAEPPLKPYVLAAQAEAAPDAPRSAPAPEEPAPRTEVKGTQTLPATGGTGVPLAAGAALLALLVIRRGLATPRPQRLRTRD